jgi:hypothetical protein
MGVNMLNPKKLCVSGGILWSICMFICTILAMYTGYFTQFLNLMASIYPGYSISWLGSIIGLAYGFVDAFVGLFLLAWLYNKLDI